MHPKSNCPPTTFVYQNASQHHVEIGIFSFYLEVFIIWVAGQLIASVIEKEIHGLGIAVSYVITIIAVLVVVLPIFLFIGRLVMMVGTIAWVTLRLVYSTCFAVVRLSIRIASMLAGRKTA